MTFLAEAFGKWQLGYQYVHVALGRATTKGLALYARKEGQDKPCKYIVFSLKEAIGFFADNHVPAKAVGKLLAKATSERDWK